MSSSRRYLENEAESALVGLGRQPFADCVLDVFERLLLRASLGMTPSTPNRQGLTNGLTSHQAAWGSARPLYLRQRLAGALGGARTHPAGHRAAAAAQPRVEQVAWRVADHVQAVHHQGTIGNCFPPSRCGSWLAASATKRGHAHGFDHAASRRPRRVTGPRPCAVRGHDGGRVVS